MTFDVRITSHLPTDFFNEHPDLRPLGIAAEADLDGNHQLNVAQIGEGSQRTSINETEYNLYRANLYETAVDQNTPNDRTDALLALLQNPQDCVREFLRAKQAGQLANVEREARNWLPRAEQALQAYPAASRLSLQTYFQMPQTFRDHIAPNYFRHLALAVSCNRDGNQEVSLEEVTQSIRSESQARLQQREQGIQRNFNETDSNDDHKINLEELKAAEHISPQDSEANARLEAIFNRLDANHDQGLDLQEFQAIYPRPSEEDYRTEAQILLLKAHEELNQAQTRLNQNPENFREIDRLSSRVSVFDLSYLDQLDTATRGGNNLFRILDWMRSQNSGQNLLTHERANELLATQALDIRPLIAGLSLSLANFAQQGNLAREDAEMIQAFILRFRDFPQHILTEEDLRLRVLANPLSIGELRRTLQRLFQGEIPPPLLEALAPFILLAGEDGILNREEIDAILARRRLSIVFRSIQGEIHNPEINRILSQMSGEIEAGRLSGTADEILNRLRPALREKHISDSDINHLLNQIRTQMRRPNTELQAIERPHFLPPLWTQFDETKTANPDAQTYTLTVSESHRKIDGNQFLARALIQYAYLRPSETLQIIQQTERRELFYLIEDVVEKGLWDQGRAHAGDGVPGIWHYLTHPRIWRFPALSFRERVVRHASGPEGHQKRREAIQALRNTLANPDYHSLREAIAHIPNEEQRIILREVLHVEELERIYYIPNSREQEEAYTRFATYTLRGQVNPENGILDAFRRRFAINNIHSFGDLLYNPLQRRNSPAAATVYDRLYQYTEHAQIQDQVRAGRFDLRGNGGDLNPLHWSQDFSDDEMNINGLWDSVAQQALILGGGAILFRLLRAGFGLGGVLAQSRLFTGLEFYTAWRENPNRLLRVLYWPARLANSVYTLPLHRELSAIEVNTVNATAIRYARNTRWGGFLRWRQIAGFVNSQRANLEAGRLLFHRNPQTSAANMLRLSQMMLREAEAEFASARTLSTEAQTLAGRSQLTAEQINRIEAALREAADASRAGHSLEQIAVQQRSSLGTFTRSLDPRTGLPQNSEAYQRLEASLAGAERIPDLLRKAQSRRAITGVSDIASRIRQIEAHLAHLKNTQTQMQGLSTHQAQLLRRGALAAGGALYGLARLSENAAASQVAARMINPAMVMAQNPLLQGGSWQLYFLGWQMANNATLSDEYRENPSLQEWALEMGITGLDMPAEQLQGAYTAHRRYRGSRAVYRNAFLNPVRERNENEPIRAVNLRFPQPTRPRPE